MNDSDADSLLHHLILVPGVTFVPRELAARFAPLLGATAIDEAQRLRYCGGWLWRDGERPLVARLAEAARALALDCRVIRTEAPIEVEVTERVHTADLEEGRLYLEVAHELIEVAASEIVAIDLGVIGEARPARTARQEEMHRWAEGMLTGLSFTAQREALLSCGLGRPNPQLFLAVRGREAFLRIERGTRFPTLVEEAGPQALDNLLIFIDRLLGAVGSDVVLPEVRRFWERGTIEPLLRHRIEEREYRLGWLRAWLDHGTDEVETGEGGSLPEEST